MSNSAMVVEVVGEGVHEGEGEEGEREEGEM